jgi:hypothetical protein
MGALAVSNLARPPVSVRLCGNSENQCPRNQGDVKASETTYHGEMVLFYGLIMLLIFIVADAGCKRW